MKNLPIPRLDKNPDLRNFLLKYCRIKEGDVWNDPAGKHRVGCLDAANQTNVQRLMCREKAALAIQDPPYNLVAFEQKQIDEFISWCKQWGANTE